MTTRSCSWCGGPIPANARRDAVTCSKRCRQARHRFRTAIGTPTLIGDGQPRRLAYADPPYPGNSARYYGQHPDYAGEVDHAALVAQLSAEYDAWALSTSAAALRDVLALCPPDARVAAWHRGERPHRGATRPLSAWEPVIYAAGRLSRRADPHDVSPGGRDTSRSPVSTTDQSQRPGGDGSVAQDLRDTSCRAGTTRRVDSLVYVARARMTDPSRVVGAKPAAFCRWIFELLGATAQDTFVDIFPGSGGVRRAWDTYTRGSDA